MTKVLVVDDEQGILDLLTEGLTDEGFDVRSANNGASALVQIYREQPDIVLLDLMIPVVNGYQVLREMRSNPTTKNLPIVLLTAVSPAEGEEVAVQLGANHYMNKPWKLNNLLQVIERALREPLSSDSTKTTGHHYHNGARRDVSDSLPTWLPT